MIVKDAMSRNPVAVSPQVSLRYAALQMKQQSVGILPILEDGRIVGVLTDRDLAVRGLADGKDPVDTFVRDIMTKDVVACQDTQHIDDACKLMEEHQIRRLVVTDETRKVVGLLSLDDLARKTRHGKLSGLVLNEISSKQAVRI